MKRYLLTAIAVLIILLIPAGCAKPQPAGAGETPTQPQASDSAEQPSVSPSESKGPDVTTISETVQIDEQLEAERESLRQQLLEESETLYRGYFYEEALELLSSDETLINDTITSQADKIRQTMDALELYDGPIKHIFFHSLILYPEYLFPNLSVPTGGYNEGFSYKSELERMLPQLLERGYILYNINDVFGKDANGEMRQKDIYLPPGKKPLILSVDDPSYHYGIGFANRMILDEAGNPATEVITPDREPIVTYDGDVELVVGNFVSGHPEFSYRGHKGIIASTGYMGIFGYDLETEESRRDATAVCDAMKANSWIFASHSYTHNRNGYWGPNSSAGNISSDIARWKAKIEPITGNVNIFIAPFGYVLKGAAMDVITDNGFDIYCSVNPAQEITVNPAYALMGRLEIGGYSLVRYGDILNRDFFDVDTVKDAHRPPILS